MPLLVALQSNRRQTKFLSAAQQGRAAHSCHGEESMEAHSEGSHLHCDC
jgi:hypothetical protein